MMYTIHHEARTQLYLKEDYGRRCIFAPPATHYYLQLVRQLSRTSTEASLLTADRAMQADFRPMEKET